MKRSPWKKLIEILVIAVFILNMTACENKKKQEENTYEMAYEGTELALEGVEGEAVLYYIKDSSIYILNSQQGASQFYKADLDGSSPAAIGESILERESVEAFLAGNDGSITYVASCGEEEPHYELVKLDANGKEELRENITNSLNLLPDSLLKNVVETEKGNVILADTRSIYILNAHFQLTGKVQAKDECQVADFARTRDGELICVIGEEKQAYLYTKVYIVDEEKCKWGKEVKLDTDLDIMGDCITDGMDYDFYYKDGGIYGYNIGEKQSTKLLDNNASYMTFDELNGLLPAGDGRFIGMMYGMDELSSVLGMYTKIDPSVMNDKHTITYGCDAVSGQLRRAAAEFCRKNKDYRIEFKTYEKGDEEDYSTRMLADIVAGKVPDIIDITCLGLSPEQCVRKGLLEDLTPYYENDLEVSPEDLVPSVAEAMKMDGKFYFLSPYFNIHTAVGKTKDVGSGTGWTFDEVRALLEERGDDVMLFESSGRLDTLYYFLLNGVTDFIDWETGECYFNSQEFKDVLELCNRGDEKSEDDAYDITRFKEGKILLQAYYSSISPAEIQTARQMFGEDITCIGYPDKDKQGSYFDFTTITGIYSKSPVKEKAWEFLRLVMTKEYQSEIRALLPYMPVRQDDFDLRMEEWMATEPYTNEFGREIEPLETYSYNGIEHGPVSKEDAEMFVNLVNNTKKRAAVDWEAINIVGDEAQVYFKGEKGLDEIADIIQDRVKTYVNENR